ncbi:hypothetical protein Tco_1078281 [Tanacetum coccineum]
MWAAQSNITSSEVAKSPPPGLGEYRLPMTSFCISSSGSGDDVRTIMETGVVMVEYVGDLWLQTLRLPVSNTSSCNLQLKGTDQSDWYITESRQPTLVILNPQRPPPHPRHQHRPRRTPPSPHLSHQHESPLGLSSDPSCGSTFRVGADTQPECHRLTELDTSGILAHEHTLVKAVPALAPQDQAHSLVKVGSRDQAHSPAMVVHVLETTVHPQVPLAHHLIPTGTSMAQNQNKQTCM